MDQRNRLIWTWIAIFAACLPSFQTAAEPNRAEVGLVLSDFEQPGRWEGVATSTEHVKQGKFSGKWERMEKQPAIRLEDMPHDWSAYAAIQFWMYNEKKLPGAGLQLLLPSENEKTDGMDYWQLPIDLGAWQGWRRFLLRFKDLPWARNPMGWNKIDRVEFTASGWGHTPNPEAVIYLDDMRVLKASELPPPAHGPRLTDADFFNALDLKRPGLEKVAAAVKTGDYAQAKSELLAYYRRRRKPRWFFDWREGPRMAGSPPRKGSPGGDYYSTKIAVDWTGWKHFRLRKSDFNPTRKPIGWDWINGIMFTASGWGETPDPSTELWFDDFRLAAGDGSGVSLGDFETDTDHWRGIVQSDERAHSGKHSGAWTDMVAASHIDNTRAPVDWTKYDALEFWAYSPRATGARITLVLTSDDFAAADEVMAHRWMRVHGKPYDLGPNIKWDTLPFKPGDPEYTKEWTWCGLNRMGQWQKLMDAYWQCGDEKYARETVVQMLDWVHDCPVPLYDSGNGTLTWRTLEAGIRMTRTWPDVFFRLLASPSFTPEACCTMVKSMVEHARQLLKWRTSGNWLMTERTGLLTVGILFPEFKEAPQWRRAAFQTITEQLKIQVYPDGAQFELSTNYHHVVMHDLMHIYRLARLNDIRPPSGFAQRFQKMFYCDMYLAEPDGHTPALNDGFRDRTTGWIAQAHRELYLDDPVLAWAATKGRQGRPPEHISYFFPYAGWAIMRSAWLDKNARYGFFDVGPFGAGHQHEDKLSIVVYGYGREHITDPGNYMYDHSKWRRYVLSTRAHNTVRIDGCDQHRGGLRTTYVSTEPVADAEWLSNDRLDYAAGVYRSGYGPKRGIQVAHHRQVVFVKCVEPQFFLVVDTLEGQGGHSVESLFHLDHDEAEVEGSTVRSIDPKISNIVIAAAPVEGLETRIVKGQTEPEVQGFIPAQRWRASWKHPHAPRPKHGKREIPTAVFTLRSSLPAHLAYVILPTPAGAQPVVSCRFAPTEMDRGAALRVEIDGKEFLVILGPPQKPGTPVSAEGKSTTERAAVFPYSKP